MKEIKEYRGIRWNGTKKDLALKLGIAERSIYQYFSSHHGMTQEEYIDMHLDRSKNNKVYKEHMYHDIIWNGTDKDLAEKLNVTVKDISQYVRKYHVEMCGYQNCKKSVCSVYCKDYYKLRERIIDDILSNGGKMSKDERRKYHIYN